MTLASRGLLTASVLVLASAAQAQTRPPAVFVDKGACPFECCTYREWRIGAAMPLFKSPSPKGARLGTVAAGTRVTALTGEVRTSANRFVVTRPHPPYQPGDTLWVYTYHGEGAFTVWFNGRRYEEDLGFSPYGGTFGKRCSEDDRCWGHLESESDSQWWVQVRLPDGRVGWIFQPKDVDGADACG